MILQGNCLDTLGTLESESVDCCITSPPYWGLRDYGEGEQLGLEKTPEEYVANMVRVFAEVKRVLKPRGVFVTTASQPFTSLLITSNLDWFKYEIIWRKSKGFNFLHARNSPIRRHENVLVFSDGIIAHANQSEDRMTYNPQGTNHVNKT